MTRPLWDKGHGSVDAAAQEFCAADDVVLDRVLFVHDLRASRAHVAGLARIGMLQGDEAEALVAGLHRLEAEFRAGNFVLDARFEDGHSAIEHWLGEQLGETGRKVHAGRSRNDQVLVAMRLYLLDALRSAAGGCLAAASFSRSPA